MTVCNETAYTGGNWCTRGNPEGVPTGVIFSIPTQKFTVADFLLKASWDTAVKNKSIFPIVNADLFKAYEGNNADAIIHEHANQTRSFMKDKTLRLTLIVDANEEQAKEIKKLHNKRYNMYLVYGDIVRGCSLDSGVNVQGLRTSAIFVVTGDFNLPDGTKGNTMIMVDFLTTKDKVEYAWSRGVSWDTFQIEGLTEVNLETVGTPTATEIVLDVFSESNGYRLPIQGLEPADFTPGAGSAGTITTATESTTVPGRYTLVTVGLANDDTIGLVAPASISVAEYFIVNEVPETVSGIA